MKFVTPFFLISIRAIWERRPSNLYASFTLTLVALSLAACGHTPVTQTFFDAIPALGQDVDAIALNPKLRYLRVEVGGRVALMVLGYVDSHPEGEISTWYSSEGEVLRLQNGRVIATVGLETDWRAVRNFSLPAWKDIDDSATVNYRRERDEMPGYRYGIVENVALYPIPVPSDSKLKGVPASDLRWFAESTDGLSLARYALRTTEGGARVVYAEQCLSRELCINWQIWPIK